MATAISSSANFRDKLRMVFCEVIGDELQGGIEKFVRFDNNEKVGQDCAVVFTTSGDVYAIVLAENSTPCEGIQRELKFPHLRARKLHEICGLGVTDVCVSPSFRRPHILIATGSGQLYGWGDNGYGQLGVPWFSDSAALPLLIGGPLAQEVVVKVASGFGFSVCVTAAGEVWAWGRNEEGRLGNGDTARSHMPGKVRGGLEHHRVVSVSCGWGFTVALTDEGQLWSWGCRGDGQLGHSGGEGNFDAIPRRVELPKDAVVKSFACGDAHVLASTSDGQLYTWGRNDYGQIGNDDREKESVALPLKVNFSLATRSSFDLPSLTPPVANDGKSSDPCGRHCIAEVAAHSRLDLSGAKTVSGQVYLWGRCAFEGGTHTITVPILLPSADLDGAFLEFSSRLTTFQIVSSSTGLSPAVMRPSIYSCLRNSFNDETSADVKFVAEGKAIHVHKGFLKMRRELFCGMFALTETNADTIKITEFSFPVYHAYLFFLYTERLPMGLSPIDLMGLVDLAQSYGEEELRALCVACVARTIKSESAPIFYAGAIRCAAKDLEALSCDFMIRHLTDVVSSGTLKELEREGLLVTFLEEAARKKGFRF